MSEYRVAARYAKALFLLAEEQGVTDAVRADLSALHRLIADTPDLARFLEHAALSADEQQRTVEALFGGRTAPLTARFLALLVDRRRLAVLGAACEVFEDLFREARHILQAQVSSAFELRPDQIEALRRKLQAQYRRQIELAVATDPALVGGFVVRVRDTVHDCSVRGQLHALQASLVRA